MSEVEEKTYADAFREHSESTTNFDVATGTDTIKGWNDRRKSNNQVISGLVPFVQLIGLFDEEEYEKMFKTAGKSATVVFDDNIGNQSAEYDKKFTVDLDFAKSIKDQIKERFINLYIVNSVDHGLNVAPMQGIVMAEKVSQMQDPSGGIGITDLQVDYGKSNVIGSRKFNLRMTINDPKILDERFEYSKLATFGAQFLLLYGWSNPESIPGYDAAMAPPKLEDDPTSDSVPRRKRLIVPIRNLGNGGYWSAGRVNISNYDFGFNEMGKLEVNITLRDDATLGMASTTMSSIAKQFKGFLDSGNLETIITSQSGAEFTLKDALKQRQIELNRYYNSIENATEEDYAEYTSQWDEAVEYYSSLVTIEGAPTNAAESAVGDDASPYLTEDEIRRKAAEAHQIAKGYPEEMGLFIFKQVYATIPDDNPDEDGLQEWSDNAAKPAENDGTPATLGPTKQVITYEKRPAYYFLGAIMDAASLSLASPRLGLGARTVPSFFYRDVSPDSKLSTSFQSKLKSVNRATGMEERIQEAVIRLKERFLPPTPIEHDNPDNESQLELAVILNRATQTAVASEDNPRGADAIAMQELRKNPDELRKHFFGSLGEFTRNYVNQGNVIVSGTEVVYEGVQTDAKTKVINALFPAPPHARQLLGAPMRGFFISVNTSSDENLKILSAKNLAGVGVVHVYLPDWKEGTLVDAEGNASTSAGSPDGFDPLNPSDYRAAQPAHSAQSNSRSPFSPGFDDRSKLEGYGRGGRFYMVMVFKKNSNSWRLIVPYDVWRMSASDTWNLLQKTWHNLYREYLAAYFERVIRLRVNELELLGIPVEAIFNEPLDLDWMTGIIYTNSSFGAGDSWIKPASAASGIGFEESDVPNEIERIDQKASVLNDIITQNTEIIEGKAPPQETAWNFQLFRDPRYLESFTGLMGAAARLVRGINNLKIQIELLTGGRYQRDGNGDFTTKDIIGNIIMLRFRNFSKVIASDTVAESSWKVAGGPQIDTYKPEIEYDYKIGNPIVKEEWVLWNDYNIPTNNFQNRYNVDTNEWVDELNKAERWKQGNLQSYERSVVSTVNANNRTLQERINTINLLQDQLNEIYVNYQESKAAIQNAELGISNGQKKLAALRKYSNNEDNTMQLSLYDDTSDIDGDGVFLDVGRDVDMHLTTKVAQQWHNRFSGIIKRGVSDVANYVAPQGGKAFQLPTNNYRFKFDRSRRGWAAQGTPIRVLDPEFFLKIYNGSTEVDSIVVEDEDGRPRMVTPDPIPISSGQFDGIVKGLLKDLSHGINPTDATSQVISKDLEYAEVRIGHRTEKSYQNWSLFGIPGIPYENKNNKWGFRYGPPFERTLANDNVEQLGGNYVKTYKDFLDLFGLGYNPNWPESLRIVGNWPMPSDTLDAAGSSSSDNDDGSLPFPSNYPSNWKERPEHTGVGISGNRVMREDLNDANLLKDSTGIPMYTLVDEIGNILVDDGNGWYRPTGWFLDFAGKPIFLYPSRDTACEINNTSRPINGVAPGHVTKTGGLTRESRGPGADRQRSGAGWGDDHRARLDSDGRLNGRTERFFQAVADKIADIAKTQWEVLTEFFSGDLVGALKAQVKLTRLYIAGFAKAGLIAPGLGGAMVLTIGLLKALRRDKTRYMNDGLPVDPYGTKAWEKGGPWGGRIGLGEHCMNLTLSMKQSLIHYRPSGEDKMTSLGADIPGGPKDGSSPLYNGGWRGESGKTFPPYSNTKYPYGTGWYHLKEENIKQDGPYVFPERAKNWKDWSDFLQDLPGYGFLTQIDNSNYTSCVVQPNGQIADGREMNDGFVKFVIENVYAPLPKNRRCGARNNHKPIKILGSQENKEVKNYHENERLNDVTYADLFGPLRDDSEDDEPTVATLDTASYGNIDNFVIDNVKNIPIRAEVVNNLVNKNNNNMSIIQFFGEIFKPGAVGANSGGNQQVASRQREDGTFEIFAPSSINWKEMANKYAHLYGPAIGKEDEYKKRFPKDIIVLDFKAKDSLIESLDMNSTFDPITARAFRDASQEFTGNSDALLHFMSYKDIAPDLLEFFKKEAPHIQGDKGEQPITIDDTGTVTLNRQLFMKENEVKGEVQNVVSKFLQANPARLNSMRALLLAYESSKSTGDGDPTSVDNYATQLLANYMRKTTVTIHGTTNISPMQKIIIKGIMPDLEGMYLITNTRESITPQGFQTILEGVLVQRPSDNAMMNAEGVSAVPGGKSDEVDQVAFTPLSEVQANRVT